MSKFLGKITLIIFANLFAFLVIGHILDAVFKTDGVWLLVSVLVSIPVLALILLKTSHTTLHQLHDIREPTDDK